jgi:hypothetical protein
VGKDKIMPFILKKEEPEISGSFVLKGDEPIEPRKNVEQFMRLSNEKPNTVFKHVGQAFSLAEELSIDPSEAYKNREIYERHGVTGTWDDDSWLDSILIKPAKGLIPRLQKAIGGLMQEYEEGETKKILDEFDKALIEEAPESIRPKLMEAVFRKHIPGGEEIARRASEKLASLQPDVEPGSLKYYVGSAVQTALNNLIYLIPSIATKNPAYVLTGMGLQAKGETYIEQREGGSNPFTASLASLGYGVSEVLTEFIPVGIYLKPGLSFTRRLLAAQMTEIPTEILNEIAQEVIDKVTINPEMTMPEALERIYETAIVTAIATPMLTGVSHAGQKILEVPDVDKEGERIPGRVEEREEPGRPVQVPEAGVEEAPPSRALQEEEIVPEHIERAIQEPREHIERAIQEPREVSVSVGLKTKQQTKDTLNERFKTGEIAPEQPVRLTTVDELRSIVQEGGLTEGEDFEGRVGISAQVTEGTKPIVAYGASDRISAAIVFPADAIEGKGVQPNEVKIRPDTDINDLRFVIGGHNELLTFDEINAIVERGEVVEPITEQQIDEILAAEEDPEAAVDRILGVLRGEEGAIDVGRAIERLRTLPQEAQEAFTNLEQIGRSVWTEGKQTVQDFTARMKEVLGDLYDKFKDVIKRVYQAVKEFNERL